MLTESLRRTCVGGSRRGTRDGWSIPTRNSPYTNVRSYGNNCCLGPLFVFKRRTGARMTQQSGRHCCQGPPSYTPPRGTARAAADKRAQPLHGLSREDMCAAVARPYRVVVLFVLGWRSANGRMQSCRGASGATLKRWARRSCAGMSGTRRCWARGPLLTASLPSLPGHRRSTNSSRRLPRLRWSQRSLGVYRRRIRLRHGGERW